MSRLRLRIEVDMEGIAKMTVCRFVGCRPVDRREGRHWGQVALVGRFRQGWDRLGDGSSVERPVSPGVSGH